jgi:hypothetical protein
LTKGEDCAKNFEKQLEVSFHENWKIGKMLKKDKLAAEILNNILQPSGELNFSSIGIEKSIIVNYSWTRKA